MEVKMEWISVKDRLPNKSKFVLVCENGDETSSLAWFNENGLLNPITGLLEHFWWERRAVPVDFWMELPKPPESEE
jgi:hypothetical protein